MDPVVVLATTNSATTNVFVYEGITPNPKAQDGAKGTVNGKEYDTRINFITKGTYAGTNSIKRLYQVSATAVNADTGLPVPFTNITVLGKKLGEDGIAHVVLQEGSTNPATPTVVGAPNHTFTVGASRMKLDIVARFSGQLAQRQDFNFIGWTPNAYDAITNTVGTDALGAELPFTTVFNGNPPATWLRFAGAQETSATVWNGTNFNSGWVWQRDVEFALVKNQTGDTNSWDGIPNGTRSFTPNALAAGGNDNAAAGATRNETPDYARTIYSFDSPAIRASVLDNHPVGTVFRFRLYAREWLTWQGAVVSEVVRWNSWVEIRKYVEGSWEYVPGKNRIQPTAEDEEEVP